MPIDAICDSQLAGEAIERGNGAVGPGPDARFVGGVDAFEEVVGLAEVGEDDRRGLPVDAATGDEPVVGVSLDLDGLEAGHAVCYTSLVPLCQQALTSVDRCAHISFSHRQWSAAARLYARGHGLLYADRAQRPPACRPELSGSTGEVARRPERCATDEPRCAVNSR